MAFSISLPKKFLINKFFYRLIELEGRASPRPIGFISKFTEILPKFDEN